MGRLFDEHALRRTQSLDGAWSFRKDPLDCGKRTAWYLGIPYGHTVAVPSVWNTERTGYPAHSSMLAKIEQMPATCPL